MKRATELLNDRNLAGAFLFAVAAVGLWSLSSSTPASEVSLIPCPFHELTGEICPGCGMTRACVALAQGQFTTAWSFHPFAFVLVGLSICFAFFPVSTRRAWRRVRPTVRTACFSALVLSVLGLWVYRLVLSGS
jgi:hypothetical protein